MKTSVPPRCTRPYVHLIVPSAPTCPLGCSRLRLKTSVPGWMIGKDGNIFLCGILIRSHGVVRLARGICKLATARGGLHVSRQQMPGLVRCEWVWPTSRKCDACTSLLEQQWPAFGSGANKQQHVNPSVCNHLFSFEIGNLVLKDH